MISSTTAPLRKAAALAFSVVVFLCSGLLSPARAQDEAAAPPADSSAAPADAAAPAADAAPADASAAPADAAAAPAETPAQPYDQTVPVETTAAAEPEVPVEKGSTRLEKVEVTGSRIKRTDYESAQPVAVITRKDIERTGLTNIGDLLLQMTSAGSGINTTEGTIFLSGGETNLDLRNLGTVRVLILVNGHRWVNGLESTSTSAVDLNTIPTAIIERVEILKDGASAIYGSDAIAGVVNIITRKNYSGIDISSQYGRFAEGDGARQQHQVSYGLLKGGTSLFANISYSQDDVVKTITRSISASPTYGAGKTRWSAINPEGLFEWIPTPVTGAIMGTGRCPNLFTTSAVLADPSGQVGSPVPPGLPGVVLPPPLAVGVDTIPTAQLCIVSHTKGTPGTSPLDYHFLNDDDLYNRYTDSNLQNPSKRTAFFAQLNQNIFEWMTFNFEGLFNIRRANSQLRPQAMLVGDLAGAPETYVGRDQMYNPFHEEIGHGTPTSDQSPIGAGIGSGAVGLRLLDFPVITSYANNTIRLGGSFTGTFEVVTQAINYDLGYSYSSNNKEETRTGDYRRDRMTLAIGPAANCTGDCVPLNIFAGPGGITKEMVDYLRLVAINHTKDRQDDAFLNLSTDLGPVHLPAGPINLAIGAEYRRDEFRDDPDPLLVAGLSSGNNSAPTKGKNAAKEAYAELDIPILSDLPLIKLFDINLAGRFSKYNLGGSARTAKGGVRWKIYDDLLLRGTYSSAFRAPSLGEFFLGDSDSFDSVDDPCAGNSRTDPTTNANCNADGVPAGVAEQIQTRATFGGNKELTPETARTATYGLVFSPSFLRGLDLNADFYAIRLRDFITLPGSQFIIDSCYTNQQRSLCDFVHRNPNGTLANIENRFVNYAALNTSGIDFGLNYMLPIPQIFGRTKIQLDGSYLIRYDQILPVPGGGTETVGSVGQAGGFVAIPRWKAIGELLWTKSGFSISWRTRMVYHMNETCVDAIDDPSLSDLGLCSDPKSQVNPDGSVTDISENQLKTTFYHDLQLGYEFAGSKVELIGGVRNIFNTDPPPSYSAGLAYFNYDVGNYELPGSFPYAKLTIKF